MTNNGRIEFGRDGTEITIHTFATPAPQPQLSFSEISSTPCESSNAVKLSCEKSAMAAESSGAGDGI
jgi:hypothetical protein